MHEVIEIYANDVVGNLQTEVLSLNLSITIMITHCKHTTFWNYCLKEIERF
jgi:hypothetical protein